MRIENVADLKGGMTTKRIGLCIAYTGTNYGQLLQAFATQQIIRKKGF